MFLYFILYEWFTIQFMDNRFHYENVGQSNKLSNSVYMWFL